MACNKRNTQYSTHFPRLEGGTCGSGNRTGNILGKLDAQRIIFNLSLFSFAVFFLFFSFYAPLVPPLVYHDTVTCCSFAAFAFAFALHVICMTKEQQKMSEMSCQLTTRANQYKNKSNNKWRDYQIPIREWAVDWSRQVCKTLIKSKSFFSFLKKLNSICLYKYM